jgi:hypothetical protein
LTPRLLILLGAVLLLLGQPGRNWAAPLRENLPYRISLGTWTEIAQVNLTLKEVEPGRYLAEFSGGAKGVWSLLNRWLPERYQTEMVFRDGRFQPLVYREEIRLGGRHVVKEYRFDYEKGRLAYWRQRGGQKIAQIWQVPLKEPVYDPLSLFYNIRTGAFGPLAAGETLRVQTIPRPEPQEMVIQLGPETDQGRKVMVTVREKSGEAQGPYFIYAGSDWVPQTAWFRVLQFSQLTFQRLDSAEIWKMDELHLPCAGIARNPKPK